MKKIITVLKNDFLRILRICILFNQLLSIIGIIATITAAKTRQYDSPLLFAVPLSNAFWIFFFLLLKNPRKNYTEEQLKAREERLLQYDAEIEKMSCLKKIIFQVVMPLIVFIYVTIPMADFIMMLVMVIKTSTTPSPGIP